MRAVAGILLLVAGVAYPMFIIAWLNRRLARKPGLSPRQLGRVLAFNAIFPVSLIFWGLGLMVPRLWAVLAVRMVAVMTALAALALLQGLWAGRQKGAGPAASEGSESHGR